MTAFFNWKNYVFQNVGLSRIDNPFTLVRRYTSKRHSSFLDHHMKLSHCHVDKTAMALGTDLGPCLTSMMDFFAKKSYYICFKKS